MAVQRVFCVFCVSPFSYAWRVAYWRATCCYMLLHAATCCYALPPPPPALPPALPADACARTSHAHFESQLTYGLMCRGVNENEWK